MRLGAKLVRETLPLVGTDYVEMSAIMAKYNPFAKKAGMKRIAEQAPPKEATKIVELLHALGFNEQLLGSEKYVLEQLDRDIARYFSQFPVLSGPFEGVHWFKLHLAFPMRVKNKKNMGR